MLIAQIEHIFHLSNSIKAKLRFIDVIALIITIKSVSNIMQKLRDLRKQFKFSITIKSITMLQITLIIITKIKSLSEQLSEKATKIKIILNVAIYSTSKFVEFNNVIINKLTAINKHIYEVFE